MTGISSRRWWTKKLTRTGVTLAGAAGVPLLSLGDTRAYALTYHRVGDVPRDPFCVSVRDFERQVAALAAQGRAVSLDDVEAFVRGARELPRNACLVTIDDGMLSTYTEAVPTLVKHGVPAALFVSSSLIGRSLDGAEEPYMSWAQLREIAALPGIAVGSHAHTHRSLGALSRDDAFIEARTSREILEDQLGRPVRCFAYPFGTTGDFDTGTDALLREAGYSLAFNSIHGAIRAGMNPVSLPRVKVEGGEPLALFELVSRGATLPWQVVDRHLWRLQRIREERI
ncbi:MAG: polysaccharide deacetylase family protein [Pseudomonadales bacterium]